MVTKLHSSLGSCLVRDICYPGEPPDLSIVNKRSDERLTRIRNWGESELVRWPVVCGVRPTAVEIEKSSTLNIEECVVDLGSGAKGPFMQKLVMWLVEILNLLITYDRIYPTQFSVGQV